MSESSTQQRILHLALPAMGERLLTMTIGIVDTMLVGHLGAAALAAVSLASEWLFLPTVLFWAISTGTTAVVARAVGAKDASTGGRALQQAMLIGLACGLVAVVLVIWLAEPAMELIGAEPDVILEGVKYMRIAALALPLAALMYTGNAALRAAGDTRTTMMVMAVVNVLNIAVAWTAINGPFGLPRLGVSGSALGALTGQVAGGLLVSGILLRGRSGLKLTMPKRPDREMVRRLLRVGVPAGAEQVAWRLGMMVFARLVAGLGTVSVAAHAVVLRAESLSYMPAIGFAVAGTALVGQDLGAGNPDEAERTGYSTFKSAALIMTLMGLVFALFPRGLIGLFTTDTAVIEAGVIPLQIIGLVQAPLAAAIVFAGGLRGAGDTRFPMLVTTLVIWLVRVPAALVLGSLLNLGLSGAWLGIALDLIIRAFVYFGRFRGGRWKLVQV